MQLKQRKFKKGPLRHPNTDLGISKLNITGLIESSSGLVLFDTDINKGDYQEKIIEGPLYRPDTGVALQ